MNRLVISLVSVAMVAAAYVVGAGISSMFTSNSAEATETQCVVMCPGQGAVGNVGQTVQVDMPSGGVGGSTSVQVP